MVLTDADMQKKLKKQKYPKQKSKTPAKSASRQKHQIQSYQEMLQPKHPRKYLKQAGYVISGDKKLLDVDFSSMVGNEGQELLVRMHL